jgi:hypothetical protein
VVHIVSKQPQADKSLDIKINDIYFQFVLLALVLTMNDSEMDVELNPRPSVF